MPVIQRLVMVGLVVELKSRRDPENFNFNLNLNRRSLPA